MCTVMTNGEYFIILSFFSVCTETLVYDLWDLVNGVGGLLGLTLGYSALSITKTVIDVMIVKFWN